MCAYFNVNTVCISVQEQKTEIALNKIWWLSPLALGAACNSSTIAKRLIDAALITNANVKNLVLSSSTATDAISLG
jgi:hypothetical protein